jgi:hypothetical protein
MAKRYECWGSDREDFTQLLKDKYAKGDIPVFFSAGGQPNWRFPVTCPQGHKNVFTGSEPP